MAYPLVLISLSILLAMPFLAQTPDPPRQQKDPAAEMTLKGCLRAQRANPDNPDDKRVIYTLEVYQPTAADRSAPTGTAGRAEVTDEPKKIQLSPGADRDLSKYVGKEIQVRGELLQPPGTPPGVTQETMPLPRGVEQTFRVASVSTVAEKCR